jgi:hypothetical protein
MEESPNFDRQPISLVVCEEINSGTTEDPLTQVVSFEEPMRLLQIRLPRNSTTIHCKHKKYENQFIENGFDLVVFGLKAGTVQYELLFSETVNTDKAVREFVIPVLSHSLFTQLVFKGSYKKTLVVVYAETPRGPPGVTQPPQAVDQGMPNLNPSLPVHEERLSHFPMQMEEVFPESPSLAVSALRRLRKSLLFSQSELRLSHEQLCPELLPKSSVSNINPSLFSENDETQRKDDLFEMAELEKLDQLGMYLKDMMGSRPESFSDEQVLVYFSTLNESIDRIKGFVERRQSQMSRSFFFENSFPENNKLSLDFCEVLRQSIRGQVGGEIEQTMSFSLLHLLSNSEAHVQRLCDFEFVSLFLSPVLEESSVSIRLTSSVFDCFANLVCHKGFRGLAMDDRLEIELRKTARVRLRFASLSGGSAGESSGRDQPRRREERPKESRERSAGKGQLPPVGSERTPESTSNGRVAKDPLTTDPALKANPADSKAEPSKRESVDNRSHRDAKDTDKAPPRSDRLACRDPPTQPKRLEGNFLFKINLNSMLLSDCYFKLKRFRSNHQLMSLVQFIDMFRANVKHLFSGDKGVPSMSLFEDTYFCLNRIGHVLRELATGHNEVNTDQLRVNEDYRVAVRKVFNNQLSIKELLSQSVKAQTKVVSCLLANLLKDEHYLDYLVLFLSHSGLAESAFFESTLQLVLRQLFFLCTCRGGVALLVSESQFTQSLLRLLKAWFESEESLCSRAKESTFGRLSSKDSFVFSKFVDESDFIRSGCFDRVDTAPLRIASMAGQFYFFVMNLNTAVSLLDRLSFCLSSWDNHQELLIVLSKIHSMFSKSTLSQQAVCMVLRESYFLNTLTLVLKVDDLAVYQTMRFEIAIVCRIICKLLSADKFKLTARVFPSLLKTVANLEDHATAYSRTVTGSANDQTHLRLLTDLANLKAILTTFAKANEDFAGFLSGFQSCSRYTHTNVTTLISNKQHYSNVDREFPRLDPKKYFSRLNDYLSFFKSTAQPDNRMTEALTHLKVLLFALKSNPSLNQLFVSSNLFDIVNFLALIGEHLLTALLGTSQSCREVQRVYQEHRNDLVSDCLDLFALAFKVLVAKAVFKEQQDVVGKEYENVDLFNAVINLVELFRGVGPNYFYELCVCRVFEMKQWVRLDSSPSKAAHTDHRFASSFRSFCFAKETPCFDSFLSTFARQKAQSLFSHLVRMVSLFSRFPGSFDTLLSELLFAVFARPDHREVFFLAMALFVSEPRRHQHREKVKKIIHSLLFEKVRTAKHSKLVLMQKYGCMRLDSMLDLHIVQNGFMTTIEYLLCSFLTATDQRIVYSFGLLIVALVEWKDPLFCQTITLITKSVLKSSIRTLLTVLGFAEQPADDVEYMISELKSLEGKGPKCRLEMDIGKLVRELGRIGQLCQHMCLASTSGTLKVFLLEEEVPGYLFLVFWTARTSDWVEDATARQAFLSFKAQALRLLGLFMNEDIGFQLFTREGALDEKQFTDILVPKDIAHLMEFLGHELALSAPLKALLRSHSPDPTSESEALVLRNFMSCMRLLVAVAENPVSKSFLCFSDYYRLIEHRHRSMLDLKELANLLFRFADDLMLEGRPIESNKLQLNVHSARRVTAVLDLFLQSAHLVTRQTLDDAYIVHEHCLNALTTVFFKGKPLSQALDKLRRVASKLSGFQSSQGTTTRITMMLDSLESFGNKVAKDKPQIERFDFLAETCDVRTRLSRYAKQFYKYEDSLVGLAEKRGFADCPFSQLAIVLESKFLRVSRLRNIGRDTLTRQLRAFSDHQCEFISRGLLCQQGPQGCPNQLLGIRQVHRGLLLAKLQLRFG